MIEILLAALLTLSLYAENNDTVKTKQASEQNTTKAQSSKTKNEKEKRVAEQVKEQMKKEQKYAKEQIFYQGDDYDLKAHEVDPNALADVPVIEPELDFDMDDVYRDDI